MSSGGGGSSQPTQQTVTQVTIPPELMPYAKKLLGTGESLAYNQPYQTYEGQRFAGFNPLQMQAFNQIQSQQVAPQIGQATGFAGLAALEAQKAGRYTPGAYDELDTSYLTAQAPQLQQYQMDPAQQVAAQQVYAPDLERLSMQGPRDVTSREYTAPQMGDFERVASTYNYTPERVAAYQYAQLAMSPAERVRADTLREYRMGPAALVESQEFGPYSAAQYMSPYMQDVVEQQKQAATRDYARMLPGMSAEAARAGAKGGTREALLQAEAQRGLQERLGGIEATGRQQAFQQAAQQYNIDQQQRMQAQLANQAAIQDVARQNLQAAMGIQSLGAGQSLEAQRLNQAMGLTVGQQNLAAEQARQQFMGQQSLQSQLANQQAFQRSAEFKAQQEMQAALANQQAGLTSGQQNLGAALQTQGLNAQQAMQAQLANQQMGFNVGQQNLAAAQARQQLGAQQAMQAGLANQQYGLQAALANQQAGLTVGQQNLAAQLGVQQLGSQQGLQAMLANQQAQLQQQQQALAQRQFGAQFGEQSRQFGANLGLQGIQQQLAAAGLLGNLGQQQFGQQSGINQAQLTAGTQMQQLEQARLQAAYEDFIARQRYPYQQLGFMSDLIRGTPTSGGVQTMYQSQPSMVNQIAGAGLGLAGLYGAGR